MEASYTTPSVNFGGIDQDPFVSRGSQGTTQIWHRDKEMVTMSWEHDQVEIEL